MADRTGYGRGDGTDGVQPTAQDILNYQAQGLQYSYRRTPPAQYDQAVAAGGSKLQNAQLIPRQQLMTRILELWPSP